MDINEKAIQELMNGIEIYVKQLISSAEYDKTKRARIMAINSDSGTYTVLLDGTNYEGIKTRGGSCSINDMVWIKIPLNNYNNMYIEKF